MFRWAGVIVAGSIFKPALICSIPAKDLPAITWNKPQPIVCGQSVTDMQFNPKASVLGSIDGLVIPDQFGLDLRTKASKASLPGKYSIIPQIEGAGIRQKITA